jgi:hypothetical protein
MFWTDRIRQVKIILVIVAIVIALTSLLVSHYLVQDLSIEERKKMETWAEALHVLNHADEDTDLSLVLDVIRGNTTIPVVILDSAGNVSDYRNFSIEGRTAEDSGNYISQYGHRLMASGKYIKIDLPDSTNTGDYQLVCYDDSVLLKRLSQYPYWQLGIVLVFVVVAIFALLSSKKAEQNKVWVGLSKETAHQLGTPVSSLMAWVEILKENHPDDELIPELDKDVKRLERIAERFSKIGSLPEMKEGSLNALVSRVVDYMRKRISKKVEIICHIPEQDVIVNMNESLIEWVIENLCKNAVDAMEDQGEITLSLFKEYNTAVIEVMDNGKGIRKKDVKHVFTPGFTTKQRGWGLGLSLAKRIVEDYHQGRIFVKNTELGKGTTFRIEL